MSWSRTTGVSLLKISGCRPIVTMSSYWVMAQNESPSSRSTKWIGRSARSSRQQSCG
jgi:hypothetical protein